MARRNHSVRLDSTEWAALRRLPGSTMAEKIRYAVQRATVGAGLAAEVSAEVRAEVRAALSQERGEIEATMAAALGPLEDLYLSLSSRPSPVPPAPPGSREGGGLAGALDSLRAKGVIK